MPISKILDDGRVEIYNSKTGQVKQVTPEELPAYSPTLVGDYLKIKNKAVTPVEELANVKAKQELENIKTGGLETGTSEQLFKKASASRAVKEMESTYGRGDAENVGTNKDISLSGSSGISRGVTKVKRAVAGFLGINPTLTEDINKYRSQRAIAIGMLTQAFGSGTPQEGESKRLIESAPDINSTNAEAEAWFEGVRNLIGQKDTETSTEKKKAEPEKETGILEKGFNTFVKEPATQIYNVAKDIGTGVSLNSGEIQSAIDDLSKTATQAEQLAKSTDDPEQKAKYQKMAQETRDKIDKITGDVTGSFSEDIGQSNIERGLRTGVNIGAAAEAPALLGIGKKLISTGVEKAPSITKAVVKSPKEIINKVNPFNIVSNKRKVAVKALEDAGVVIDETKIAEDLVNYVDKAPLTMKKKVQQYALDAIDRFKNPSASITETLENLTSANESAFLQSGNAGRATASKVEKLVGDSIRKQLAEKAPDVAAANKAFEMLYKGKKAIKYLKFPAALTGAGKLIGL